MSTDPVKRSALITLSDVDVVFGANGGRAFGKLAKSRSEVHALRNVDLSVARGEALGLVGESGSGKSTSGRLMMGMLKATSGSVTFDGDDIGAMDKDALKALRARLQMVYQNALGSLDSRMKIGASLAEPLRIHGLGTSRAGIRKAVISALELVGLSPGEAYVDRYPNQLSGGQQQRVVIARALITSPEALILDESLASADVSIRVMLLDLLIELKRSLDLTYVFITHELALARYLCDRLVILYRGEVVETGPSEQIFAEPKHPYTKALIDAVPAQDKSRFGESGNQLRADSVLVRNPTGCPLFGRCPVGVEGVCDVLAPPLLTLSDSPDHAVSCHYAEPQRIPAGVP